MEAQAPKVTVFSDELEEFAYATSHDLRAPLRAIENVSRWIEEDLQSTPSPELAGHLNLLHLRVGRMNRLLDDLLAYSRAGTRKEAVIQVDLNELALEAAQSLPRKEGIRLEIDPGLPTLKASASALGQVLGQLISNAVQHHDKMTGLVRVSARELESSVEIKVQDDGPGIDPRSHERIFKICQTLKPKEGMEGSGVGLALVKKILQKHGGSVALESSPGKGSSFIVSWPKGA